MFPRQTLRCDGGVVPLTVFAPSCLQLPKGMTRGFELVRCSSVHVYCGAQSF